jgi:predicted kinase
VIVAIGGLPGVGKTTVARAVAGALPAAHVRIDALEVALVRQGVVAGPDDVGPHGYGLALAVADTCLAAGGHVVVDAVFDVQEARQPWDELAARYRTQLHWVRLVCGDGAEHRRRVVERSADIAGHQLPSWDDVTRRVVDEWAQPHGVVDTSAGDPVATVLAALRGVQDPGAGPTVRS